MLTSVTGTSTGKFPLAELYLITPAELGAGADHDEDDELEEIDQTKQKEPGEQGGKTSGGEGRLSSALVLVALRCGNAGVAGRLQGALGRPLFLSQGQHPRLHARSHRLSGRSRFPAAKGRCGARRKPRLGGQPLHFQGEPGAPFSAAVRPHRRGAQTLWGVRREDDVR